MQATPAPFGASVGFSLKYDADKTRLLGDLRELTGLHVPDRGARSARYCGADHAREIRAKGGSNFAVSLRTRGNPYYLFLTRVDGVGVCTFIDRKVQDGHFYPRVVLAHLCFDERVFDGTVIEGDLLRMDGGGGGNPPPGPPRRHFGYVSEVSPPPPPPPPRNASGASGGGPGGGLPPHWVFLCNDLLADCGTDLRATGDRLDERLRRLSRVLSPSSHRPDIATDVCLFRSATYFSVPQLRGVVEQQLAPGKLDFDVNAIVFRSFGPIGGGVSDVVFSLPRPQMHHLHVSQQPHGQDRNNQQDDGDYDYYGMPSGGDEAFSAADEEQAAVVGDVLRDRAFFIRQTDVSDVYELYDTAEAAAKGGGSLIAGVPTLRDSAAMREAASTPEVAVQFAYSARFGKWVPTRSD
jgi:hypothetical protein